jgi:integrase
MRQDEISRLRWEDADLAKRVAVIRNRKHPRDKSGNDQTIALVADAGWDPILLVLEQAERTGRHGRIFPYDGRSVGAAFRRACRELGINDLRFHDLRHETASRLFEAGYQIPEVALVTGHRDWKMLRRYTNLQPDVLAQRHHMARGDPAPELSVRSPPTCQAALIAAAGGRPAMEAPTQPKRAMRFCTPKPHPQQSWHAANDG